MRNKRISRLAGLIARSAVVAIIGVSSVAEPASAYVTPRLKPPAPEPKYISRLDIQRIEAIRADLDGRRFSRAHAAIKNVEGPIARELAAWYYYYAEDPKIDMDEARLFLDTHVDWPAQRRLQGHIERRMSDALSARWILDFFQNRDPITGEGRLQLTRALYSTGDREAGALHIRDAWVNTSFKLADERKLLSSYGGILTADDHAARVDRLLFARQVTNSRRVLSRLTSKERRKADARIALILAAKNAQQLYNRLSPEDRNDAGVKLAAVRYFRRAGEEPRAVSIARTAPKDAIALRNPSRWWYEQQLLMRWAIKNGLYADAYAMAAGHGLEPGSTEFSEAEFNAGWIALRFLNEPARAKTHFAALTGSVSAPISVARGTYWMGRAAEAQNDEDEATRWFKTSAEHIYTFYGQLAAEKLGGEPVAQSFIPAAAATPEEKARFASRPTAQALRMLAEIGDQRAFLIFGYHLDDQLDSPGEYIELGEAAMRINAPHVAVRAGKVAVRRGAFAPQVSYPLVYVPDDATRFAPAELILGLSRQESEFNPRAYSRAGARGMMQLIPSTAQITARKERLPYRRSALLNDPVYNMTIGSAHLSHLLKDFNGSFPMVLAAYNAGPHRVRQWIDDYGDPRSPAIDPIDWMEKIPFAETRNYVQRVLENMQIYRSQLSAAPIPGSLANNIERGGKQGRIGVIAAKTSRGAMIDIQDRIAAIAAPVLAAPQTLPVDTPLTDQPASDEKTASQEPPAQETEQQPAKSETQPTARAANKPRPISASPESEPTPMPAVAAQGANDEIITPSAVEEANQTDALNRAQQRDIATDKISSSISQSTASDGATPDNQILLNALPTDNVGLTESVLDATDGETETLSDTNAPECKDTYINYIAETDEEEASAEDLNAGALAELQSGGPKC